MKRKISVQLSEQVAERLEAAAKRPGANKTAIVEAALDRFLDADCERVDDGAVLRRLDGISRQLEQLDRDLRIVSETAALHARYHLTVTPALPVADQRAACVLGAERFEVFAAQVGRRVHLGTPLMRETMERLGESSPGLLARNLEEGAPLGAQFPDPEPNIPGSTVVKEEAELSAAAREGGSNGGFPQDGHSPSR
jgi:hypothetical protein